MKIKGLYGAVYSHIVEKGQMRYALFSISHFVFHFQ